MRGPLGLFCLGRRLPGRFAVSDLFGRESPLRILLVSGEQDQDSYIREKLGGAATTIRDDDGRSIEERVWSAYRNNLSSLRPE